MGKREFWTASFQCLAKSLLVVFTRQLEILVTTLQITIILFKI